MADRFEARVQGGKFYGYAGPLGQGLMIGGAANGFDRTRVGIEIARGVFGRARALAEHVEGIALMP